MSDRQSQTGNRRPLIIAHRGSPLVAPENTLRSFRVALATGARALELDVHVSRDGVPVVFHDHSLRRLTGDSGQITNRTRDQLHRLRVAGTERIPGLADALRFVRGRALVQVEIKRGAPVAPVVAAVRRARAERFVHLASFSGRIVRDCARLAPDLPRELIAHQPRAAADLLARMRAVAAGGLSLDHRLIVSRAFVRKLHAAGATVWCWTVNNPARARRLEALGVDGIITDNPALLRRALRQR
jgi:glycerophosphoryl diester phosphodiesterase